MNNFFDKTGVMAIGTRLRLLSERVSNDTQKIFELYEVEIKAKWYPVVYSLLESNDSKTVTSIASEIGHSHVSVVKIIKEMSKAGFLIEEKDENDKRKTNISLSEEGLKKVEGLKYQHKDVSLAIEKMLALTTHNIWSAMDEFEALLDEKSTYPRVLDEKRKRESLEIEIVPFEEKYENIFIELNKKWIDKYFKLEQKDIETLKNPKETIIKEGGEILVALYENKAVGVCALIKSKNDKYDYELAKMAVDDNFMGRGIGLLLGEAIIKKAKELDAKVVFLDSNTCLESAINLYKKLGFKKKDGYSNPYERSNIQMELIIK